MRAVRARDGVERGRRDVIGAVPGYLVGNCEGREEERGEGSGEKCGFHDDLVNRLGEYDTVIWVRGELTTSR